MHVLLGKVHAVELRWLRENGADNFYKYRDNKSGWNHLERASKYSDLVKTIRSEGALSCKMSPVQGRFGTIVFKHWNGSNIPKKKFKDRFLHYICKQFLYKITIIFTKIYLFSENVLSKT